MRSYSWHFGVGRKPTISGSMITDLHRLRHVAPHVQHLPARVVVVIRIVVGVGRGVLHLLEPPAVKALRRGVVAVGGRLAGPVAQRDSSAAVACMAISRFGVSCAHPSIQP